MSKTTYQEALDYIYSHVDYSIKRTYRYSAEVFELQRVIDLLDALGNPHARIKAFHIAGTKGKGSVSALIASVLEEAGYKTGLYTSPHLSRLNERIIINGEQIPDKDFVELVEAVKPSVESIPGLTVFEILTAMAFTYFAEQGVEYAAVEVGLGGRLDATNVLAPIIAVITSLSYDHMHLLGESLSDIAREKAGIIKTGIPVVLAPQQFEAERVVETVAEAEGAPLIRVGHDWLYSPGPRNLEGQTLYIWSRAEQPLMDAFVDSAGGDEWAPPRYQIPLLGHHQVVNAAVAYAAIVEARNAGLDVKEADIQAGFRKASWLGRFQILSRDPLIVADAAHNRDSALKLRIALDDYFPGQPVTMIFGASADKDIEGMLTELRPRVSRFAVTQADHPRSENPEVLAGFAHSHGVRVEEFAGVEKALQWAIVNSRPGEVILVTGSIFIVGEAIETMKVIGLERV
ncbi:MAG: folylpolyglutamate synthase/dihydrofolate synthase family protein [Chloroflexota bacterium]|nr:folylpolyglutamate synthase/dihydrofolate synthase family protein [Chloroflexota bacterium]